MTVEELLTKCREITEDDTGGPAQSTYDLAFAVVDKLGVGLPCGYDDFLAIDGDVVIPEGSYTFGNLTPEDARGVAAALLRAADAAEAQTTPGGAR